MARHLDQTLIASRLGHFGSRLAGPNTQRHQHATPIARNDEHAA
jgi:hypothetical protein